MPTVYHAIIIRLPIQETFDRLTAIFVEVTQHESSIVLLCVSISHYNVTERAFLGLCLEC